MLYPVVELSRVKFRGSVCVREKDCVFATLHAYMHAYVCVQLNNLCIPKLKN